MDDFQEIVKAGLIRSPCTLKCSEINMRGGRTRKTVSVSFRASLLPPEVVEVLQAARLSAAYSPSQRVVRVKADDRGHFQLSKAPKTTDVYVLRFPYQDTMPWVEKRVQVEPDVNVEQRAVFLEIPGITPERAQTPQLSAPAPPRAQIPAPEPGLLEVPRNLGDQVLSVEEAALISLMSDGKRYSKEDLVQALQREGHGRVSVNALLGKVRYKLLDRGVEPSESTDRTQVWLPPMSVTALRRLVRQEAA